MEQNTGRFVKLGHIVKGMKSMAVRTCIIGCLLGASAPGWAVQADQAPAPQIIFQSGTGNGSTTTAAVYPPLRAMTDCASLSQSAASIRDKYYPAGAATGAQLLEQALFETALSKYQGYFCVFGRTSGPAVIVIVDFAKHSSEPRLHRVDLRTGAGLDAPIRVAHGIGSDPDDDGYASFFSNVEESLTSSLGAALGAERYSGINGLSLRLDGLEPSNSQMRERDIVVHSYAPERRRYFNAAHVAVRGRPGSSEGCFVVEPDKREWILQTLENGGFLYAGYGSTRPAPKPPAPQIIFASGTGAPPASAMVSETSAGMPGSPPIAPISQDQEGQAPQ